MTERDRNAQQIPAALDLGRPDVPDVVVPRAVLPFFLPRRSVRGRLVRLGPLAEAILARHRYPPAVATLAAQALALVAALAGERKFRGSLSLQAKGDGAVPILLADCTERGELRTYARTDEKRLRALLRETPEPTAAALLGRGHLAFTIDQGGASARHQGIVAIEGETLEEMAGAYFQGSVQLAGLVRLAAGHGPHGWRAGALLLERIAGAPDAEDLAPLGAIDAEEGWRTAAALAGTLHDVELLDDALAPEQLLYRLFHTEGVAADRPRALAYGCRCTRARLAGILDSFPPADLDAMVKNGAIAMVCEFCNHEFRFSRADFAGRPAD